MMPDAFNAKVAEAKARLTHWTIPELRHICVEGMTAGGWMRFEYDVDGNLDAYDTSDNVRLVEAVTGKPNPSSYEINAAWELAYELAPKSANHISNRKPIGTELNIRRYIHDRRLEDNGGMVMGRCVVIGYGGSHFTVRFDDGDVRSHPMPISGFGDGV